MATFSVSIDDAILALVKEKLGDPGAWVASQVRAALASLVIEQSRASGVASLGDLTTEEIAAILSARATEKPAALSVMVEAAKA